MSSTLRARRASVTRIGFNGELHEQTDGWQVLGNGYRIYCPVLMRFHGPDNLSPYEVGGRNGYAFVAGDPINYQDPSGHRALPVLPILTAAMAAGALALGAAAVASRVTDDRSQADILGAVAGVLAAGAIAGGLRALYLRNRWPKVGELFIRRGKHKDEVLVHGNTAVTAVGKSGLDGTEFSELLKQKGVGNKPIKLRSCYSANGVAPQGQVVANATGQPVTAYAGRPLYHSILGITLGGSKVRFRPETGVQKEATAIRNREINRLHYTRR